MNSIRKDNLVRTDVKQRLFVTATVMAMIFLYSAALFITAEIESQRSSALTKCLDSKYSSLLFDLCWHNTRRDISPSIFQYLTPFLPALVLVWLNWLLKLDYRLEGASFPNKTMKWLRGVGYFVGVLACFLSFYVVLEKQADRLYLLQVSDIFSGTWIASGWLGAPLLFKHLHGSDDQAQVFQNARRLLYLVLASPFLALLLSFGRQATQS